MIFTKDLMVSSPRKTTKNTLPLAKHFFFLLCWARVDILQFGGIMLSLWKQSAEIVISF